MIENSRSSEHFLYANLRQICHNSFDWCLDKWFGIETSKSVELHHLDYSGDALKHARRYQASRSLMIIRSLNWLDKQSDLRDFTFFDVGSGKGRAMILAGRRSFKSIWGAELSQKMCEQAIINIFNVYSPEQINRFKVIQADVRNSILPKGKVVYFLYNPFDDFVLKKFINRIIQNHQNNQECWVVFLNPLRSYILDKSESFELIQSFPDNNTNYSIKIYRR